MYAWFEMFELPVEFHPLLDGALVLTFNAQDGGAFLTRSFVPAML
jgi:hypothetical protein